MEQYVRLKKAELKKLVHWGIYGVNRAFGGSYSSTIIFLLQQKAKQVGLYVAKNGIEFGKYR
mgnify:CR=1 FL=1